MRKLWLIVPALLLCASVYAQWLDYPEPGVPRDKDGKVDLSAPAPRIGGKPDLTGVWMHEITPADELRRLYRGTRFEGEFEVLPPGMHIETQTKYGWNLLIDFEPPEGRKPGEPPPLVRPEGIAALQRLPPPSGSPCGDPWRGYNWPCAGLLSEPIKIVQAPKETIILYELGDMHRQIFTDGREFPAEFNLPAYLGYSIGRWEGDTFVVETRGFREGTSLDVSGHLRSEERHITERFHRRDFGHMDVEMTFDDPKLYTQPFTVRIPHELVPDNDIFEMFCENEKDAQHMGGLRVTSEILSKYVGTYEGPNPAGNPLTFQFRLEGSSLQIVAPTGASLALMPASSSAFTGAGGRLLIRFEEQDGVMRAIYGPQELKLTRKQ